MRRADGFPVAPPGSVSAVAGAARGRPGPSLTRERYEREIPDVILFRAMDAAP